uniref:Uncharacterized protein n=1 Tax=Candidatus Kentrum sp. UNK TaxID=2126344 RepID=A0A451AMN5_9GAMM|nr:MAG: hypothetical protein BECKUNK1418G_GA0071005_11345 [Candidatus Kentron sp. UNK]VFK72622.1 MAG: hypothetical protein BECKUNK1418H_GA0071006_11265 [Candidatus Kentron sp. UNK]
MAIHFSTGAPENTVGKLGGWIPEIERAALIADSAGGAVVNLSQGYKVRYLSFQDVGLGKLTDAEYTERWRHLIVSEPHTYGEIELDESLDPFALYQGEAKDGFNAAIKRSEEIKGDYEASVIEIPALRFIGLWLHNEAEDLIMPYPPNATALENYRSTSVGNALAVLQPLAQELLKTSAGSEPTGG